MKQRDVKIGGTYVVKVSGKLARVRITGESILGCRGGKIRYVGTNLDTNRQVRLTAAKCRSEVQA